MRQREVYDAIRKLDQSGEPAVLATVVRVIGSSPGSLGSKMLIAGSGQAVGTVGGGCVDGAVYTAAKQVLSDERPRTITVDLTESDDPEHGLICGGRVEVFLEPLVTAHLYVFGAGHVGQALARAALLLDWKVVVVDDRAQFLNEPRFPGCERLVAPFEETLARLRARAPAYVAVVTRGHRYDQQCLEWAISQDARYVGLVGSRVKIRKILERALARGLPLERLERVRAPIGLDVGAVTVEEIAASIACELVAVRRRGTEVSRELALPGVLDERDRRRLRGRKPTELRPLSRCEGDEVPSEARLSSEDDEDAT
ncbi:XdhC family protein [bacterium]|nr:XdhC family protein [bacterium]